MWSISTEIPVPEIVLTKDDGKVNVNSGVTIEEFKDSPISEIMVVESEDHFCVLKTAEKEVKTEIPYNFTVPKKYGY
jgi:hypothetical protein